MASVSFTPLPQRNAAQRELRRASPKGPLFLSNSLVPPLISPIRSQTNGTGAAPSYLKLPGGPHEMNLAESH